MNSTAHVLLWITQGFLALFFLSGGVPKVAGRGMDAWAGFSDLPRAEVVGIGVMEVLGAVGLIVPEAAGILPWLTPLAAVGLAVIGLMAAGFHARANEWLNIVETSLLACLGGVVAIGRWNLIAPGEGVRAWMLALAVCLLLPAAIGNVTVLLRRAGRQASQHRGPAPAGHALQPAGR